MSEFWGNYEVFTEMDFKRCMLDLMTWILKDPWPVYDFRKCFTVREDLYT